MLSDDELKKLIAETDDTALQARYLEILKLPPDQRDAAIADLSRAYDPMRDDLRADLERNFAVAMGDSPQGQMAGNNQFSVYVGANPLEHIASGMNKYRAGKAVQEQRQSLRDLAAQESEASKSVMMAQANALRRKMEEEEMRRKSGFGVW